MRYIIDITQLVHWPGNLTGIPRVMDELALRFLNDKKIDAIFVSWVKETGEMCEVDFASTRIHRGEGIDYITSNQMPVTHDTNTQTLPAHSSGRNEAIKKMKQLAKKVAKKARLDRTSLYKKVAVQAHTLQAQLYKPYRPKMDDIFFIPWGEWWDQNWLNRITDYANAGVGIYPVCHDILPMVVPQFSGNSSSLSDFVTQIFPLSKKVLTVSQSTKSDLSRWMLEKDLRIPPIEVFRLGEVFTTPPLEVDDKMIMRKYSVEKENFIIFVSTIEPRKNHVLLYYVYKLAISRGVPLPKLLIIGRLGHDTEVLVKQIKADPEVNEFISICNSVDDAELNWLYQNCMFSVMPSLYEGWGMSVLESISKGKPVACSNSSSLKEMPKDCVLYFNPASTDECLAALQKLMQEKVLSSLKKSAEAYKPHSWDASYKQVLSILKEN